LLAVLVSRLAYAKALLAAVAQGTIARAELSAFHARQIRGLNDPELTRTLGEVWGEVRDAAADKQPLMAQWRARLTPASLSQADKQQGRAVFQRTCAACHTLYGEGGKVGPDL